MVVTRIPVSDPHKDDESLAYFLVGMIQRDNYGSSTISRKPTRRCTSSLWSTQNHGVWVLGWTKCGTYGELVDDLVEHPVSTTSVLEHEENDKDGDNLKKCGSEDVYV